MKFSELVEQARTLLQRQGRVSYRALKREFDLDDEYIEDLKAELIDAQRVAVDEENKVLVWIGTSPVQSSEFKAQSSPQSLSLGLRTLNSELSAAERRQLTVMFCDLVDSTALSEQL